MRADVTYGRTSRPSSDVMPAEPSLRRMAARVVPVSGKVGHVDAADERQLVIDDDRLLVVAMERMLAGIRLRTNASSPGKCAKCVAHLVASRVKHRKR